MTNRSVATLVLKVWGLMWLVDAVVALVNTALQFFDHSFGDASLLQYAVRLNTISWAFQVLVGIVLLVWSEAIARRLFPQEEAVAIAVDAPTLQAIGFSLLAVYFVVGALHGISVSLYTLLARPAVDTSRYVPPARGGEYLVGYFVQLIAAIWLLVGTPRLVRFLRRLQEPWTTPKDAPPPDPSP